MVLKLTRKQYTDLFGPTTGDKVRLGDTDLMIQIEKDLITPGDECVWWRKNSKGRSCTDIWSHQ
jgi:urease subunit alpha